MKPQKLSTKLNPLGEFMNLQEAFNQLKKQKHEASFDRLGEWLDQNTQKPKTMRNIYKVAASFIAMMVVLIACTVPVEQEEEIGYMIKGIAPVEATNLKAKVATIPGLDLKEVKIHDILIEKVKTGEQSVSKHSEVIMILPEANYQAALDKKAALSGAYDFQTLEILPIEETVERPLYEAALSKFDIKLKNNLPDSVIAKRIDKFLHEHSSSSIDATSKVYTDENGVRYVELVFEGEEQDLQFRIKGDASSNAEFKMGVEELHQDLSGVNAKRKNSSGLIEAEMLELKERKAKALEEKKNN